MEMDGFLDGFVKKTETAIPKEADDYVVDGLLYCGKCHTAKQVRVTFRGVERTPFCLCKCAKEALDAEDAEFRRQQHMQRIKSLRKMGFPDAELSRCTFACDDHANEKISTVARRYVDNFDQMRKKGKGLLLYGEVDTGKSFISACIANALIDQGYACLVTNFARLTNTISGMYEGKQEYIDGLDKFSLLVIDDLASERDTEYMNEIVTNIIDARYRSGKPLIVTTNLTAEELKNPKEIRKQRVYSRLLEMCIPVEVKGISRRKEKLKQDYAEMKDLLGL